MDKKGPTKRITEVNQVSNSLQRKYEKNENFKQLSFDQINVPIFKKTHENTSVFEKEVDLAIDVPVLSLNGPILDDPYHHKKSWKRLARSKMSESTTEIRHMRKRKLAINYAVESEEGFSMTAAGKKQKASNRESVNALFDDKMNDVSNFDNTTLQLESTISNKSTDRAQ